MCEQKSDCFPRFRKARPFLVTSFGDERSKYRFWRLTLGIRENKTAVDRKADVLWQDNFALAFYNLANCYRKGFGIAANKEKAEALEKRGAELEAECKEEIVKVKAK